MFWLLSLVKVQNKSERYKCSDEIYNTFSLKSMSESDRNPGTLQLHVEFQMSRPVLNDI